jgi:hypothetical protein
MAKTDDSISFMDLPVISKLRKRQEQAYAAELLNELETHTFFTDDSGAEVKREDRIDQVKNELEEIQRNNGLAGMRYGRLCFSAQPTAGRKTIVKALLMEKLGLTKEQIDDCTTPGEPGMRRTFKKIDEE